MILLNQFYLKRFEINLKKKQMKHAKYAKIYKYTSNMFIEKYGL